MLEPRIRLLVNSKEDFAVRSHTPWLIEGFLPAGVVTGVVGAPLSGKSSLAFHIAQAIGTGQGFADRKLNGGARRVLWVSAEDGWSDEMQQRGERGWDWLDVVPDEAIELLMVNDDDKFAFAQWWDTLADDMNSVGSYGLVVVDHLLGFTTSRSTEGIDRPQNMGVFMTALGQLARKTGCAVILIHHENKSGSAMGSVNFGVRTRETMVVKRNKRSGAATVYVEGNRMSPFTMSFPVLKPHKYIYESSSDRKGGEVVKPAKPAEVTSAPDAIRAALADAPKGSSLRAQAKWLREHRSFKESESTLIRRIKALQRPS